MVEWAFRPASLTSEAVAILATADPAAKASASRRLAEIWDAGGLDVGYSLPPPRPARPERPLLRPPKEMPKRRAFGSAAGRVALLHALAHIDHVAAGVRWFDELCRARGLIPDETFRQVVPRYFKGELKPPFNREARAAAGFPARYYEPLLRGGVPLLHG